MLPELECLRKSFEVTLVSCGTGEQMQQVPGNVKLMRYTRSNAERLLGCAVSLFDKLFWQEAAKAWKISGLRGVKRCLLYASDARQFARWMKKNVGSADLVYSFWHTAPLFGVLRSREDLGDPVVVARAHGFDLYHDRSCDGYQPYKQQCDRMLDRMYLVSQAGYDYYLAHHSVSQPPKCFLRHLGADNDRLSPYEPDDTLHVYSCSFLWDIKRIDLIINALAMLDRPVDWIHFGAGPMEAELKTIAAEKLGRKKNCRYTFAGTVSNQLLREHVASHHFDCFVTASMSEGGVPVSIAEAFSFGIPAVATDAGGICELVNADTGCLLPVDSTAKDIADALERIKSQSAEKTAAMRSAAYEKWRSGFVASDNASRFCHELEQLCSSHE